MLPDLAIIRVGDIIVLNNNRYRILEIKDDYCAGVQMDTTKIVPFAMSIEEIILLLRNGKLDINKAQNCQNPLHINSNIFNRRACLISDILSIHNGSLIGFINDHTRDEYLLLLKVHNVSRKTIQHVIRLFAQSGYDYSSLNDDYSKTRRYNYQGISRGRKVHGKSPYLLKDEDMNIIVASTKRFIIHEGMTCTKAYKAMIDTYYTTESFDEKTNSFTKTRNPEFPSSKQFSYQMKRLNLLQQSE